MSTLPSGWGVVVLGEIAANGTRTFDPGSAPEEEFELYSVPSFSEGSPEVRLGAEIKSVKQLVQEGDVLLCKIVPHLNRVWTVARRGERVQLASGEWIVYRDHGCEPNYLRSLMSEGGFRDRFMTTVSGVGGSLLRASPRQVNAFEVPIAPLPEQRRIVAKVDSLSTKSSCARDHLDHIPRLVEKYRNAILKAAIGGTLTQSWRERNRSTGWHQCLAQELFSWASGKNLTAKAMTPGSVPVIGGNGVNGFHSHSLVDVPTIVIGRVGAQCGNVHLTYGPAWITDNAIYAKTISPAIEPSFALLILRDANLNERAGGSGQPYVNQKILDAVALSLPAVQEQREIVRRIEIAFGWIDRLAAEATSARKLVDRLDQAILAKAFRGELVPQDPSDQPASVLLERINAERGTDDRKRRGRKAKAA